MDDEAGAYDRGFNAGIAAAAKEIADATTLSPDDVRGVGRWLNDVGEFGFPEIPCSVCDYKSGHYGFKFCPNCGARMKGASDEATDNS
jgi:hypothetical protein